MLSYKSAYPNNSDSRRLKTSLVGGVTPLPISHANPDGISNKQ